jgi:hypothetical protein
MTAEFLEQDVAIGNGLDRCADCERLRILEADGRCHECLHFRTVPVKAHVPMPRYRVRVYGPGGVVVFGPEDFVTEKAVDHCREMWHWPEGGYVFAIEYLNSKPGVLR